MMEIRRFGELGKADYGWLQANYHFSFAGYHDPRRMGYGVLRVVNDDRVAAGHGFDPHPHRNMEIITYVREGSVRHKDSLGNDGRIHAGEVQVMSAGRGVTHAEYGDEDTDTKLYQIWIVPREQGVAPRWEQRAFPGEPVRDELRLLVSGRLEDAGRPALMIHQDAQLWGGVLEKGHSLTQDFGPQAYLLVARGTVSVCEETLQEGDALVWDQEGVLTLIAASDSAEVLVLELPV